MKRFFWFFFLALMIGALCWAGSCDSDDDDDDLSPEPEGDDDTVDDDTIDDDMIDDDTVDDDTGPDDDAVAGDDDTFQPYDPQLCAPAMEAFYSVCHLQLVVGDVTLDQEKATESCEQMQLLFWTCFIECYLDNGEACVDVYLCSQECLEQ